MHHPGPPRFVGVGDAVELAPRDPDPEASYSWRVTEAPVASTATVGDDPVEEFVPDAPGRYRLELTAPDGTHRLTVRAFDEVPTRLDPGGSGPDYGGVEDLAAGTDADPDGGAAGDPGEDDGATTGDRADGGTGDHPPDPGGRPRVELSAEVTSDAVVVDATALPHPDGEETPADLAVEFVLDDRDDLDRSELGVRVHGVEIPREALPERARIHAVSIGGGGYSVPDVIEITREGSGEADDPAGGGDAGDAGEGPGDGAATAHGDEGDPAAGGDDGDGIRIYRPYHPPEWARDAVIYEIYVRTFPGQEDDRTVDPDTDRSAFDVIVEKLDYIEGLGVDAIWLTPVLENDHAPHGYNVTDFFSIAADLGTREDYERLIEAAHDRGIRVLFDYVANHSARDHPYFQAAVADPDSEYREWYEWRGPTEPETYFDWEYIANFDFTHLPVRRHLLDVVDEWSPMVDGFRCDMAWAVPNAFWREVHDRLKERDREFLLLDETIPYIADFQAGLFDVHFDSTTYATLRSVGRGEAPADAVLGAIDDRARSGFPAYAGFMLYAENHDETRFLAECGRPAARAALGALFTLPGSPMVYAGQEFAQLGKRDDLAWQFADEELQAYVRRVSDARGRVDALAATAELRRVDYEVSGADPDRVVAFARETAAGDAAVVVLNFGGETATVAVDARAGETDLITGEAVADGDGVAVEDVVVLPAEPS